MKVSVIVPVYNTRNSLQKMVDSLLAQTFDDFEVLLIDDGSTDGSADICDAYAKKDKRIRVFHKENRGGAMARQTGVDNAQGEYSIHADSDDWVEPTMLENMYKKAVAENADIVIADYYINYADGKNSICKQEPRGYYSIDVLYQIMSGKLFGALWNKLIKHSLYTNYNVCFYKGLNYCEDSLVWIQILKHPEVKMTYIGDAYYHYWVNDLSISHHITRKTYDGLRLYQQKMVKLLPDENRFLRVKEEFVFAPFEAAFMNNILSESEIKQECRKLRPLIFKYKRGKWLVGYFFLVMGMYKIAHKLIRF